MPIYEYKCTKCGTRSEVLQKMSDKPLTKCVKCKGKLEKLWSNTSFQLKGSGWYVTDYAAKKGAPAEKSSGSDDASAKTDAAAAPAAAAETAPSSEGKKDQAKKPVEKAAPKSSKSTKSD